MPRPGQIGQLLPALQLMAGKSPMMRRIPVARRCRASPCPPAAARSGASTRNSPSGRRPGALAVHTVAVSPARQGFGPSLSSATTRAPATALSAWAGPVRAVDHPQDVQRPAPVRGRRRLRRLRALSGAEDLVRLLAAVGGRLGAGRVPPSRSGTTRTRCAGTGPGWRPDSPASSGGRTPPPATCTGGRSPRATSPACTARTTPAGSPTRPTRPRVFSWLLDLSFDDRGNAISYQYKPEDTANVPHAAHEAGRTVGANRYLKRIFYGNDTPYLPAVEHRACPASGASSSSRLRRARPGRTHAGRSDRLAVPAGPVLHLPVRASRSAPTGPCRRILMFHRFPAELGADPVLVRSTDLTLLQRAPPPTRRCPSTACSPRSPRPDGSPPPAGGYQTEQLPPLTPRLQRPGHRRHPAGTPVPTRLENVPGAFDGTRCSVGRSRRGGPAGHPHRRRRGPGTTSTTSAPGTRRRAGDRALRAAAPGRRPSRPRRRTRR